MQGRMTVCNMSIEGGARAGMIAPDDVTFAFLEGRRHSPRGKLWEQALDDWRSLVSDDVVPDPSSLSTPALRQAAERALAYMDLSPGTAIRDIRVDTVFIGSCTNGRLEDLRAAAEVVRGRKVSPGVRALVVPGSARVKAEAEAEGLDKYFTDAGFER